MKTFINFRPTTPLHYAKERWCVYLKPHSKLNTHYKEPWKEVGNKPMWGIRTNGGKRKNGDNCFDFFIHFGYLIFNYTNFNLQGRK